MISLKTDLMHLTLDEGAYVAVEFPTGDGIYHDNIDPILARELGQWISELNSLLERFPLYARK